MRLRVLVALAAAAVLAVPAARADGDPASDFLLATDTFYPFEAKVSDDQKEQLNELVAEAKERGFTIKVAIIGTKVDLGAVPSLWQKPETYARFLGQELFFVYKGRLLIVMPNGYGVSRGGKALPSAQRVLDKLPPPGEGGTALALAAMHGVQRLAAQDGVRLALPKVSSTDHTTRDRIVIAAIAGGVTLLVGASYAATRILVKRRA